MAEVAKKRPLARQHGIGTICRIRHLETMVCPKLGGRPASGD